MVKKNKDWEEEAVEGGRMLLKALLKADKKDLKILLNGIKGRHFTVALALLIYNVGLLHDNQQKMDC